MSDVKNVFDAKGKYGFEDTVARQKATEAISIAKANAKTISIEGDTLVVSTNTQASTEENDA